MDTFNPFKFDGRIGRLQYFGFGVIWGVIFFVISMFIGIGADDYGNVSAGGSLAAIGLLLTYSVAIVSYGIRRLHDFDKSGWWYLLMFVPLANVVMGLVLLFAPGTPGENRYGYRDTGRTASTV